MERDDGERVTVTCLVDGLQVSGLLSKTPKNADVSVKFMDRYLSMFITCIHKVCNASV